MFIIKPKQSKNSFERKRNSSNITGDKNKDGKRVIKLIKLNSSFSSNTKTSSTSSNENKSRANQEENMDDLHISDEISSTTSSTKNNQKQAQNSDS